MTGQSRFGAGRLEEAATGPWPETLVALRQTDGSLTLPAAVTAPLALLGDELDDAASDAGAALADAAAAQVTADAAAAAIAVLPAQGAGKVTLNFSSVLEASIAVTGQGAMAADAVILVSLLAPGATEIAAAFQAPFAHTVAAGVGFTIVLRTLVLFTGSPAVAWYWRNP